MHLITLAHLGEAQGVIELFNLKRVNSNLFESEDLTCLITGEGPFEAATMTAATLARKSFTKVINLGIAGSLSAEFSVGAIYPVRSVYLVIDGRPQFKSFQSFDAGIDCLTSFERILTPEKALPLSGLGQLVDREAWGVAMAAKMLGIEFESHKLISDQAGSLGACEAVKESAPAWSHALASYLQKILVKASTQDMPLEIKGLYFTFTTRHQFEGMLKKIALREDLSLEEVLKALPIDEIREMKLRPKESAMRLLELMEERIDPLKKNLADSLRAWKNPLEKEGIHLQTDPTWESSDVKITLEVTHQKDLEEKLAHLSKLSLTPFYNLRNGKIHVE